MLIYQSHVRPMLARHEQSILQLWARVQQDASDMVRGAVNLGLGRFVELIETVALPPCIQDRVLMHCRACVESGGGPRVCLQAV